MVTPETGSEVANVKLKSMRMKGYYKFKVLNSDLGSKKVIIMDFRILSR